MIDTTQTNYILADTRDEVLNTQPGNGLLAISKDTSSLFVSDGNRWIETNINSRHNIEYPITSSKSISQTPVIHFDVNDQSSIENVTGTMATDTQPVFRINSSVSNEAMISSPTSAPTYIESDHNSNAGILAFGAQGMTPDLDAAEKRDGAFTVLCVYTPTRNALGLDDQGRESGIERRWDPPPDVDAADSGTYGSNRYSKPRLTATQNIINTYSHSIQQHHTRSIISNQNTLFYGHSDLNTGMAFPHSHQTTAQDTTVVLGEQAGGSGFLVPGVVRPDGGVGNRVHHWNQNYVGNPQIISIRVENNKDRENGTFLKGQLHTFHPTTLDTISPWNYNWHSSFNNTSSVINHGLSIGAYNTNYGSIGYSAHAAWHEMLYFDKYLPDSDLNALGEVLAAKWDTGGDSDTWRL